jgi:2-polyprenyl-6-methoxyphenol hydroxylase-like FAD-dependent oxidoreductase
MAYNPTTDTEVLIIGAGPVGTVLASELGRRGIGCMVIEMTDGVFRDPRLHAVSIRTMELVRKWGLTDELRHCGWPQEHPQDIAFVTSLSGYELGRILWPAISKMQAPTESPTFAQRCPQSWFNPILHRYAMRFNTVQFRWRSELIDFDQTSDSVSATVRDVESGNHQTLSAKYLVGCDGARSFVRETLGIERENTGTYGYSAEAIIRSQDLAELTRARIAGRYTAVTEDGVSASLLPYDGRDRFRMTLMAEIQKVDRARMDQAISLLIGKHVSYEYLTDILPWANRETCAKNFRVNRAFIAGDSARTMPPTGGHGMNTGVLDGFDLGWKLAAVLRGWAGDRLLDSYEYDRKKGGSRTAEMAGCIYKDWHKVKPVIRQNAFHLTQSGSEGDAARQYLGELLTSTFQREFNALGASLGYRYSGSPVIIDDETQEPEDDILHYIPTARPGHRLPHAWLKDGRSTLDLVGDVYTLIEVGQSRFASSFREAAQSKHIPLDIVQIDDPEISRLLDSSAVLVRPDQHVAWRARSGNCEAGRILDIVCGFAHHDSSRSLE